MKYLPFKTLFLCTLLPPILYIISILFLEYYLTNKYKSEIESIYTGSTRSLFDGSVNLQNVINKNIDQYLKNKTIMLLGALPNVMVVTKHGVVLYPAPVDDKNYFIITDPMVTAAENYRLLNEGLKVNVDLKIKHNTILSNGILIIYYFLSLVILYNYYSLSMVRAKKEELEKIIKIEKLQKLERINKEELNALEEKKETLSYELTDLRKEIKSEKIKASRNEDEMIEEIVSLEKEISKNLDLQKGQQEEINQLKETVSQYEKQKASKQKNKTHTIVQKRFKALYKNIVVHKRAIEGFIDLEDDLKIKSEEIIHQMNEDPDLVQIKRKVFGKKNRKTVLEVLFAYKGRLYFRKIKENKIEILTIGTKNTQVKDLEFLDKL